MVVVKKSLNQLEEKKLTEQVKKYCVLYDKSHKGYMEKGTANSTWNEIAKIFEFLVNGVCVCVCFRPPTLKASSVWGWQSRVQINYVVLKTFFSSTKFLHRYFSMNHQAFLTSHFILFAHQKRAKPRLNQLDVRLAFRTWGNHYQVPPSVRTTS